MSSQNKCPVDHGAPSSSEGCPVDRQAQSSFSKLFAKYTSTPSPEPRLSTEREVSSIPKATDGKWVYPSEAQFFAAMARKNHNPQASDMKTIVPIHNAVNERAWAEVMKWEAGRGGDKCGGVTLINFKGKPGERSWRATFRTLVGYGLGLVSFPFGPHRVT
jgi:cytochrome c heme-lyase